MRFAKKFTRTAMRFTGVAVGAAVAIGAAGAGIASASTRPAPAHHPSVSRQIATTTLGNDSRVTLTAFRVGRGSHARATVRLSVYRRCASGWRLTARRTVGEAHAWSWRSVTAHHTIEAFSTSSVGRQEIRVRLVTTRRVTSSASYAFHVDGGKIVNG